MAKIRKRGSRYQVTVSNDRDWTGKQLVETPTFVPDPNKIDRQNQKNLERFVIEFEEGNGVVIRSRNRMKRQQTPLMIY